MNRRLDSIENTFIEIAKREEMKIEDVFRYGDKKIELMLIYTPFVLSVSVVDDMSYDFTVFDCTGDLIVYNNSYKGICIGNLTDVLKKDISTLKNKIS